MGQRSKECIKLSENKRRKMFVGGKRKREKISEASGDWKCVSSEVCGVCWCSKFKAVHY